MPTESIAAESQLAPAGNETRRGFWLWMGSVLAVATTLRMVGLGAKSFWLDESASSLLVRCDLHTFASAVVHRQSNMFLYYLLLRGCIQFGDAEAYVRLLSVAFGVAAIPMIYLVAERICGARTARLASLLLSIHVFHVQYSQEARGYSLVVFLTLLSCLYFLRLVNAESKSAMPMYAISSALAVYAQVFAGLVLLAQWILTFRLTSTESRPTRLRISAVFIILAVLPLFPLLFFFSDRSQLAWMGTNSLAVFYEFLNDLSGRGGLPLIIVFAALLMLSLRSHWRTGARPASNDGAPYTFLWVWLLLPIILVGVVSLRTPVLQSRYLIFCLPPFIILAAHGLTSVTSRWIFLPSAMATAMFLLIAVSAYYRVRMNPNRTDDWRDATRFVLSHFQAGDAIVFPYSAEEIPFRDYEQRLETGNRQVELVPVKSDLHLLTEAGVWTSPEAAASVAVKHRRIWVVSALQPNAHSMAVVSEVQARLANESRFDFGFVSARLFEPSPSHRDSQ